MTCRELIEFLMDYLSGELGADERALFDQHLAGCPECAAYLKSYKQIVKLGKEVFSHPDDAVPGDVPEDLVQAILAARRKRN